MFIRPIFFAICICLSAATIQAEENQTKINKDEQILKKLNEITKQIDELKADLKPEEKSDAKDSDAKDTEKAKPEGKKVEAKKPVASDDNSTAGAAQTPASKRGAADINLNDGRVNEGGEKSVIVKSKETKPEVTKKSSEIDDNWKSKSQKDRANTKPTKQVDQKTTKKPDQPLVDLKMQDQQKPAVLLRSLLATGKNYTLTGKPESLVDSLGSTIGRNQQQQIVLTYWQLSQAVAIYNVAVLTRKEISDLSDPRLTKQAAAIRAALARADAEIAKAEANVLVAQHALNNAKQIGSNDTLSLPSNFPHTGNYRTRYEQIATGQVINTTLQQIHQTLPIRRKAIAARTEAVLASTETIDSARGAYTRGTLLPSQIILAIWLSHQHQIEFVASVNSYNNEIAQYAISVANSTADQKALVGMLIKTEHSPKEHSVLKPKSEARNTSGWHAVTK